MADYGSTINANVTGIVNIQGGEKAHSMLKSLDEVAKSVTKHTLDIGGAWKSDGVIINNVINSAKRLKSELNTTDAKVLINSLNMAEAKGIELGKHIESDVMGSIKNLIPQIKSTFDFSSIEVFDTNKFKNIFDSLREMESVGIDVANILSNAFNVTANSPERLNALQNSLSNLEIEANNSKQTIETLENSIRSLLDENNKLKNNSGFNDLLDQIANLELEVDNLKERLKASGDEFRNFLSAKGITSDNYDSYISRTINEVEQGFLTISQAKAKLAQDFNYSWILGEGDSIDIDAIIGPLTNAVSEIKSVSTELQETISKIKSNDFGRAFEDDAKYINEASNEMRELNNVAKQTGQTMIAVGDDVASFMSDMAKLGGLDIDNLAALNSIFKNLSSINGFNVDVSQLEELRKGISSLSSMDDDLSKLNLISNTNLQGFGNLNVSKSQLRKIKEFAESISGLNVASFMELTKVDLTKFAAGLNSLNIDKDVKSSVRSFAKSLSLLSGVNIKKLEGLKDLDFSKFSNLKIDKDSMTSLANIALATDSIKVLESELANLKAGMSNVGTSAGQMGNTVNNAASSGSSSTKKLASNLIRTQAEIDNKAAGIKSTITSLSSTINKIDTSTATKKEIASVEELRNKANELDIKYRELMLRKKELDVESTAEVSNFNKECDAIEKEIVALKTLVSEYARVSEEIKSGITDSKFNEKSAVESAKIAPASEINDAISEMKAAKTELNKAFGKIDVNNLTGDERVKYAELRQALKSLNVECRETEARKKSLNMLSKESVSAYSQEIGMVTRSQETILTSINGIINAQQRRAEAAKEVAAAEAKANAEAVKEASIKPAAQADSNLYRLNTTNKNLTNNYNKIDTSSLIASEVDSYKNLNSMLQKADVLYRELLIRRKNLDTTSQNEIAAFNKECAALVRFQQEIDDAISKLSNSTNSVKELIANDEKLIALETERYNMLTNLTKLSSQVSGSSQKWSIMTNGSTTGPYDKLNDQASEINSIIATLESVNTGSAEEMSNILNECKLRLAEVKQGYAEASSEVSKYSNELNGQTKANNENAKALEKKESLLRSIMKLDAQIATVEKRESAAANGENAKAYENLSKIREELKGILNDLRAIEGVTDTDTVSKTVTDASEKFSKAKTAFVEAETAVKGSGKTFFDSISGLAGKFTKWLGVSQVIMELYTAARRMVEAVVEIDTAMTELKKVTDETNATYDNFLNNAGTRAKELGTTISDVVNATADFARLGYGLDDASTLADAAIVYKNVGDGIEDISQASESVISTMQAFGIQASDSMSIVDKFNEIGNRFAISSEGVGEAMLRSSSALASANNTIDESIALAAAMNTQLQDPDVTGTTLKTLSMYLRAAKTEAEDAGESTDGMAESVSELRADILALTGNKVDIQIDENTFKSTYQIMKELSDVWGELTDVTQANILEMIGGKIYRCVQKCA